MTMKMLTAMNIIGFNMDVLYNKDDWAVCCFFLMIKIPEAHRINQKYSDNPKFLLGWIEHLGTKYIPMKVIKLSNVPRIIYGDVMAAFASIEYLEIC